jgi:short-subunit dehydrogenase
VEAACQAILKAMSERRRDLIIPWKLKLLLGLNLIHPRLAESLIKGAVKQQHKSS